MTINKQNFLFVHLEFNADGTLICYLVEPPQHNVIFLDIRHKLRKFLPNHDNHRRGCQSTLFDNHELIIFIVELIQIINCINFVGYYSCL